MINYLFKKTLNTWRILGEYYTKCCNVNSVLLSKVAATFWLKTKKGFSLSATSDEMLNNYKIVITELLKCIIQFNHFEAYTIIFNLAIEKESACFICQKYIF